MDLFIKRGMVGGVYGYLGPELLLLGLIDYNERRLKNVFIWRRKYAESWRKMQELRAQIQAQLKLADTLKKLGDQAGKNWELYGGAARTVLSHW